VEFLVISIFHEPKIPTVDMKVYVYSKFRGKKISKKMKSPIWGKLQKSRGKLQKAFKKIKKFQQYNIVQVSTRGRWATAGRRPATGLQPVDGDHWSPDRQRPMVGARSRLAD
jgi:hypothetical protein